MFSFSSGIDSSSIIRYPLFGDLPLYHIMKQLIILFMALYIPNCSRMCKQFLLQTRSPRDQTQLLRRRKNIKATVSVKSKTTNLTSSDSLASVLQSALLLLLTMSTEKPEATYTDFKAFILSFTCKAIFIISYGGKA